MQVSCPTNDVKIYNLSAGKSLPEWISARKRRRLAQRDVAIRQRIELIQDFDMPNISNCVAVSRDNQYIFAAGIYKPRVKCFDVCNMSLKFERGLDSEVIKMILLSDDYKKFVLLEHDRYVEFHSQQGFYHKIRIPRQGRDMVFNETTCDLHLTGTGSDIFRFNLEAGQFLSSFSSVLCPSLTKVDLNPKNYLLATGSHIGIVETWDPRSRQSVGSVEASDTPITAVKFRNDGLTMAVGSEAGKITLFDIRSPKPLLVKDHYNKMAIKEICFHSNPDLVLSLDSKVLKLWERNSGTPYTAIESKIELNGVCPVPETGLLFMPNEGRKILTHYLPSLGPAPRWCGFLDNLTEELEESTTNVVYDDYKFVTQTELEELGLSHLMGTDMLRAYMHGFFLDSRLYDKAKSLSNPFAFEEYRKRKIRDKMDEATKSRVKPVESLPKVNRGLARKLVEANMGQNLMGDSRFGAMFKNPDFEVDEASEDFRLLNPLVSQLDKKRKQKREKEEQKAAKITVEKDDGHNEDDSSSSDDEKEFHMELKKQFREMRRKQRTPSPTSDAPTRRPPKVVKEVEDPSKKKEMKKRSKVSLEEMLAERTGDDVRVAENFTGAKEMTFSLKSKSSRSSEREEAKRRHMEERKKIRRSAAGIVKNIYR